MVKVSFSPLFYLQNDNIYIYIYINILFFLSSGEFDGETVGELIGDDDLKKVVLTIDTQCFVRWGRFARFLRIFYVFF